MSSIPERSALTTWRSTSELLTAPELKTLLNTYVTSKQLVNAHEQQYVNVGDDEFLLGAVTGKNEDAPEFLKREDVLTRLRDHMQSWYEIKVEGGEPLRK